VALSGSREITPFCCVEIRLSLCPLEQCDEFQTCRPRLRSAFRFNWHNELFTIVNVETFVGEGIVRYFLQILSFLRIQAGA
jgi:hypothetical protein